MGTEMKIGIVLDSLESGGSELLAIRLAKAFVAQGHSVFVIALRCEGVVAEILRKQSIPYVALHLEKGVQPRAMYTISRLLKKNGCTVLLTNHFRSLVHSWMASLINGCSLVHVEHDSLHYRQSSKHLNILNVLLNSVAKFVVISPTLSDFFTMALPSHRDKVVTIVNGVDCKTVAKRGEARRRFLQEHFDDQNRVVFGTCARLEAIKNIRLMLDIFHDYHAQNPESCLLIVGDGSCRDDLQARAGELGISGDVVFAGYQREVTRWLETMDCYLITSDDEGLPLSVLEAMSSGLPVIARNVGDLPRVIDDSCGRLVRGTDRPDWIRAMEQVVSDIHEQKGESGSRLGQNGRKRVEEFYSFDRCVSSYLALFQDLSR